MCERGERAGRTGRPIRVALEGVSKSYDGENLVVRDVDLAVAEGEFVALVGESGSGKTTLLEMVNRLVEPDAGRVLIDGLDIASGDAVRLRRSIGYLNQGVGLFPHLSVAENIEIVPRLLRWDRGRIDARVIELLELVGLAPADYAGRSVRELSGGQRQRVGFARAIAVEPSVLLLDEPFGALDPITRDRLQSDLVAIGRRLALTTLLVTHDMMEALLLADRIAVVAAGRIVQSGTPQEVYQQPADELVAELLASPRKQASRLEALFARGTGGET